jgi:twitching motility protein PilJ
MVVFLVLLLLRRRDVFPDHAGKPQRAGLDPSVPPTCRCIRSNWPSRPEAVEGNRGAFLHLGDSAGIIADAVETLKVGDPARNLPALPGALAPTLADLDKAWSRMHANADSILQREARVLELAAASNAFIEIIPEIQELTDSAIRDLTQSGAPTQQVFVAGRQLVLSDRVLRHLKEMLRGGAGSVAAADSFTREIEFFEQTMNALLSGSRSVGSSRSRRPARGMP